MTKNFPEKFAREALRIVFSIIKIIRTAVRGASGGAHTRLLSRSGERVTALCRWMVTELLTDVCEVCYGEAKVRAVHLTVELHGSIEVQSALGEGTVFTMEFHCSSV